MRMFPAALRRDVGNRSLQDLQQSLLYALAADIPGNGGVFRLSGDLVDLVDIDDPALGCLNVVIRRLDQPDQNVFHIVADITRFSQGCRISNSKRNIQNLCQRLSQHGFSHAGGSQQQYVALLDLHILICGRHKDSLVVVINRHRQGNFRLVLTNDILVEDLFDLSGLEELRHLIRINGLLAPAAARLREDALLHQHFIAQCNAVVTDIRPGRMKHPLHALLRLPAKAASHRFSFVVFWHESMPPSNRPVSAGKVLSGGQ